MAARGATFDVPAFALNNTPWATLAGYAAADYQGVVFRCDDAPGGGGLVFCNGTVMQPFARGMQAKGLTLGANGEVTWTFDPPFPNGIVPVITIAVVSGVTQQIDVTMKAEPTYQSVTFIGRQSRAVPQNLVTLLISAVFSIFETGGNLSGVKFHVTARQPTS